MSEGQAAIEDVADGIRWLELLLALAPRGVATGYRRWLRCWMDMASLMAADMLGVDAPPFETWRRPGPNDGLLDRRSAQRLETALLDAGFDPLGLREGAIVGRRVAAALRLLIVAAVVGVAMALVALAGAQAAGIAVLSQASGGPSSSLRAPGVVFVVGAELIGAALLVGAGAGDRDGGEET